MGAEFEYSPPKPTSRDVPLLAAPESLAFAAFPAFLPLSAGFTSFASFASSHFHKFSDFFDFSDFSQLFHFPDSATVRAFITPACRHQRWRFLGDTVLP
jgi:hypothetical protein